MSDIAFENFIKRATDGGIRIGRGRETIMPVRFGSVPNLTTWFVNGALRRMILIKPGEGEPIAARVNYGRWCAVCECGGCEDVDDREPVFICLSCGNEGRLRPVVFPENKAEIERLLLKRAKVSTRNWTNQSVEELAAENLAAGDEV
jgi:hypothetical protein